MPRYLANAFSLGMLDDPTSNVRIDTVDLGRARSLAVGARSIVGHIDTAAIFSALLGTEVVVDRTAVRLVGGDELLVGQLDGGRLPPGTTSLPEGAAIRWMRVTLQAPPVRTPITLPFREDMAFVERLRNQTVGEETTVLACIPTNDSILALALAQRPRKVVFLRTQRSQDQSIKAFKAFLEAHLSPSPDVKCLPEAADDGEWEPLDPPSIVKALHDAVGNSVPRKVGLLVTTGTSEHTALLMQYAQASGARAFHVGLPYLPGGGPDLDRPERTVVELTVPRDVRDLLALRQAADLADGGNLALALDTLQGCETLGDLGPAFVHACHLLDAREGLRLEQAQAHLEKLSEVLTRQTRAVQAATRWKPLTELERAQRLVLRAFAPDGAVAGGWNVEREVGFAAEAYYRAGVERQRGRLDLAALLDYRFAEAAVAARLRHAHKIDPDKGLSARLDSALEARLVEVGQAVHGPTARPLSPDQPIDLVAGLVVLEALGDVTWCAPTPPDSSVKNIIRVKELARQRNRSIFAHGFQPMDLKSAEDWRKCVDDLLVPLLAQLEPLGTWGRAINLRKAVKSLGQR